MLNSGQTLVINSLIDYINSNYKFPGKYKLLFDELFTNKDSICITTVTDSTPNEKLADVTGGYVVGTIRLSIVFRMMKSSSGIQDLDAISIVDSLYSYIKSVYKSVNSDIFYIDKVSQISGAKLDTVYPGGVKDFRGIFELSYERKVI